MNIFGNVIWLDRGEIRPNDLGIGEFIAHLDSPGARTSRNIEDSSRRVDGGKGSEVILAAEEML